MLTTPQIDYLLGNVPKKVSKKQASIGNRHEEIKALLHKHGPLHVNQICELLQRSAATLNSALREVVEQGDVARTFLKPTESATPGYVYRINEE